MIRARNKLIFVCSSSMNSISTNPFEDDEDIIEEQMEVGTCEAVKVAKPARKKKRRAPQPPGQQQMVGMNVLMGRNRFEGFLRLNFNF